MINSSLLRKASEIGFRGYEIRFKARKRSSAPVWRRKNQSKDSEVSNQVIDDNPSKKSPDPISGAGSIASAQWKAWFSVRVWSPASRWIFRQRKTPYWRKGADSTATLTYALTTSGTTLLGLEGRLFFMKKGGYESPVGFSIPFLGRRSTNLHLNHFLHFFITLQEWLDCNMNSRLHLESICIPTPSVSAINSWRPFQQQRLLKH